MWLNGAKFEGHFSKGLKDGKGLSTSTEGRTYYEYWSKGNLVEIFGEYSGESRDGQPHGHGKLQSLASKKESTNEAFYCYDGSFNRGMKEGFGKYFWKDAHGFFKYVGHWMHDQINGLGVLNINDVEMLKGRWKDNSYDLTQHNLTILEPFLRPMFNFEESTEDVASNTTNSTSTSPAPFSSSSHEDVPMSIDNSSAQIE